jgi:hypothetical protein
LAAFAGLASLDASAFGLLGVVLPGMTKLLITLVRGISRKDTGLG